MEEICLQAIIQPVNLHIATHPLYPAVSNHPVLTYCFLLLTFFKYKHAMCPALHMHTNL